MNEYNKVNAIYAGDCLEGLKKLPDEYVQCCITSPPYWKLRDYGIQGQYGLEATPESYVGTLLAVLKEVWRVLKTDGTLWLNLGDMYWGSGKAGSNPEYHQRHKEFGKASMNKSRFGPSVTGRHRDIKDKDLVGFPWMVAFALRKQGWYLRQDIIWHKPNPMPESVTDRCTKAHEYIFLLSKSKRYYYNNEAIKTIALGNTVHDRLSRVTRKAAKEPLVNAFRKQRGPYPMANRRSVWSINNRPFKGAHFATFPEQIPELCILAGSRMGDSVLDPFMGAGTTALIAGKLGRKFIGFELNPDYVRIAEERLRQQGISVEKAIREN